jgi:ABC-type bacteriocin/lantibiotic exporter with double-glycine peptidase domain
MQLTPTPLTRILSLVKEEKSDITSIYFFAILNGLIQLSLPIGIQAIIGFVLAGSLSVSLIVLISAIVFGVLMVGIMQINQMKIIEKIQQKIFVRYAFAFADRIPQLDLKKVDDFYLPELVNRFFDTISMQKSISKLLLDLPAATIQILFGLILLSFYHPAFILFGLLLVFILWVILYYTGNKGLQTSLEESKYKYAVVGWFEELARLVKTIKFSANANLHTRKADEKTKMYLSARTRHFIILLMQYRTLVGFKVIITAAMMIVGSFLLLDMQINIGQFVAAEIIVIMVINSVEKIIMNLDSVYDVLTAVEKVSKITDKPIESFGNYLPEHSAPVSIEAQHLSFGYYPEKQVLTDVSFKVNQGEKVCITGNDGAGKTTLLKVLTGSFKGFDGSLLFNNVPIGNYDLPALREKTGILFPAENIFEGTLWENITMGYSQVDKAYVTNLVQQCGLLPFLSSLPEGYDSHLDPAGKRLSRNVIQKIQLIRALAHKPKLLLLEEPWQGVEEHYKLDIQQLLLGLQGVTVLVATNDESFARKCNKVIDLKK